MIEDLHWSDDTSLEFLHYLARRCASHPFVLLLTYRSEEVHPVLQHLLAQLDRERLAGEYVLAHLTRSEVEAMLQAIFVEQRGIPDELRELLYTLTDGNPFFIEEVLKSLLTSRRITFTDSGWMRLQTSAAPDGHLSIPRSVQDAVSQRTRRLSPQAKQLLMLAAVAGRRFDVSVLQRLLRCNASQLGPGGAADLPGMARGVGSGVSLGQPRLQPGWPVVSPSARSCPGAVRSQVTG